MNGRELTWAGSHVIMGEMEDDTHCVRTKTGRLMRLWKDVPLNQRASFFQRAFAETSGQVSAGAVRSPFQEAVALQ